MKKYPSVQALVNAKGRAMHFANLNYGGVFDANNKRVSDLQSEIQYARTKLIRISPDYAKLTFGINVRKPIFYIDNFGYATIKSEADLKMKRTLGY